MAVAVARRRGATWYLAGLAGERAVEFARTLDFLGAGAGRLTLWRDAGDDPARATVREARAVAGGDVLSVRLAPGGGFCAKVEAK